MIFVESSIFTKHVGDYLTDDEYADLQRSLIDNPEQGVVIRNSGGIRKVRWKVKGRGKRGGIRIIYYINTPDEIWMLTIYSKAETDTIKGEVLRKIKQAMK